MATRTFPVSLPEVGLELVYEADATSPADLFANQSDLAKDAAELLSLHSLIETLELKKQRAQERILERAGKGIRYIKKHHGRRQKLKTIGVYVDWDIDLEMLRSALTKAGHPDIYDACIRRGAPGRFIAAYKDGDREAVLKDLATMVEPLGVQVTPFGRQVEFFAHMPTLHQLCEPKGIRLRGVKKPRYTFRVYEDELKES